eukprot:ANDGO_08421.mRNA.1 hypothetical protein
MPRKIEEKEWNALKDRIKRMLFEEQRSNIAQGRRMSFIDSPESVTERNKAIVDQLVLDLKASKRMRSLSLTAASPRTPLSPLSSASRFPVSASASASTLSRKCSMKLSDSQQLQLLNLDQIWHNLQES